MFSEEMLLLFIEMLVRLGKSTIESKMFLISLSPMLQLDISRVFSEVIFLSTAAIILDLRYDKLLLEKFNDSRNDNILRPSAIKFALRFLSLLQTISRCFRSVHLFNVLNRSIILLPLIFRFTWRLRLVELIAMILSDQSL